MCGQVSSEALKVEIERLLPKWNKLLSFTAESWQTKYMNLRLGTCNTEKRSCGLICSWPKPIERLEYVILHDPIHLRERTHNSTFIAYMDMYKKLESGTKRIK